MQGRLDVETASPAAYAAMLALTGFAVGSGLEASLLELVMTRASQLNRSAYCVKTHTADARAAGESEERLYLLAAWREAPIYSARERAALAWTEALTELRQGHIPDPLYDEARREFSEAELVNLTVAVGMINAWNRLAIAFRAMPETEGACREAEPPALRARG